MTDAADEPSVVSKAVSGVGCGVGCLGGLTAVLGGVLVAAVPLDVFAVNASGYWFSLGLAIGIAGFAAACLGAVAYVVGWLFVP